jgi:hypothetical protein
MEHKECYWKMKHWLVGEVHHESDELPEWSPVATALGALLQAFQEAMRAKKSRAEDVTHRELSSR